MGNMRYNQVANQPAVMPTPQDHSYSEKSFLHDVTAAVKVPFYQAAIIAVGLGIASLVLFLRSDRFLIGEAVMNAATVTVLSFVGTFCFLVLRWMALTKEEKPIPMPIPVYTEEEDEPEKPPTQVWVKKVDANGTYSAELRNFRVPEHLLIKFAAGVLNGAPTSRRYWMGRGFTDSQIRRLQEDCARMGYLEEGSNGFELTEEGRDFFEAYAQEQSPTPL